MAKKLTRKDAEACLKEIGMDPKAIDWSKINLVKIMEIVQAILSLFKSAPQAQKAVGDDEGGCTCEEACAAHFAAIQELAACGLECCESGE